MLLDALAEQSSGDELFGERNRRMPAGKGRVCSGSPLVAAYGSEAVGRGDFKNRGLKPPAAAYLKAVECFAKPRPSRLYANLKKSRLRGCGRR